MPHDLLERRGLSGIIEWNYLKKVVLAEASMVIYPLPGHGRKVTLRLFKEHVVHLSLFFRDWCIKEVHLDTGASRQAL